MRDVYRSSFISPDAAVARESGSGLAGEEKSAHTGRVRVGERAATGFT